MRTDHAEAAARSIATSPPAAEDFAADVRTYLTCSPRQLPSRYLYDALGSSLFDAICRLPWYRITRAECALLRRHGRDVLAAVDPPGRIIELGGGNGEKLSILLAGRSQASVAAPPVVHLVDVSRAALDTAEQCVAPGGVPVVTHQARFMSWLETAASPAEPEATGRTLMLFLGSNIGNFDPPAAIDLVRRVRAALRPGDAFLLGADLVKPEDELQLAYDDPLGVTAAFNLNLLVRINRELAGRIDLSRFTHRAVWNDAESRVEMHLVSTCRQSIDIPGAGLSFVMEAGETIWTESSYKYTPADLDRTLERGGFVRRAQWIDSDVRFALTLAVVPED